MLFKSKSFSHICGKLMIGVVLSFLFAPVTASAFGCQGGTTTICSASIPLPDVTPIGDRATVHVPASVLGGSYAANPNLLITVECVGDGNGGGSYRVLNADKISCDVFPCQASSVRLCNTSVSVPGGTPLGGTVHMTMPPPFVRDGFTVQCVGSAGNPPAYQLIEHAAVSCVSSQSAP